MSLNDMIQKLSTLKQRIADEGVAIMRGEVPHGETGRLEKSIFSEINGDTIFIGTEIEYAKYVVYGRGEVRPVRAKSLHWTQGGKDVFAMKAGKVDANDFVKKTADKLSKTKFL